MGRAEGRGHGDAIDGVLLGYVSWNPTPAGRLEAFVTTKKAFSPEEWDLVLEGPPTAGMIVITASGGGMFKETWAMSKAYAEARAKHGESELLDEIVATKPKTDHGVPASRGVA